MAPSAPFLGSPPGARPSPADDSACGLPPPQIPFCLVEVLAASSGCKAQHPGEVAREAARLAGGLRNPAGLLVLLGGGLVGQLPAVAAAVAAACPGLSGLVVAGAWVMSQTGELEDQSAAAILVWSGAPPTLTVIDGDDPARIGEELGRGLVDCGAATAAGGIFLAVDPDRFDPSLLDPLAALPRAGQILGLGTQGSPGAIVIHSDGTLRQGAVAALGFRGLTPPRLEVSPAARLLTPLQVVSAARGSLVLRLGDTRALDALTAAGKDLEGDPLLLAALADAESDVTAERAEVFLRPIRGVDPARRGLFVSEEVRAGVRLAIAARDAVAARDDLEAGLRRLRRSLAGAVPRFGIYVSCTGRGARLFGNYDVEGRALRAALGDLPLVGISGTFQIAPHAQRPRLHLFAGALALFTAPS